MNCPKNLLTIETEAAAEPEMVAPRKKLDTQKLRGVKNDLEAIQNLNRLKCHYTHHLQEGAVDHSSKYGCQHELGCTTVTTLSLLIAMRHEIILPLGNKK